MAWTYSWGLAKNVLYRRGETTRRLTRVQAFWCCCVDTRVPLAEGGRQKTATGKKRDVRSRLDYPIEGHDDVVIAVDAVSGANHSLEIEGEKREMRYWRRGHMSVAKEGMERRGCGGGGGGPIGR